MKTGHPFLQDDISEMLWSEFPLWISTGGGHNLNSNNVEYLVTPETPELDRVAGAVLALFKGRISTLEISTKIVS
ncbi:hypothetical protein J6590_086146 [Homalodisca vitripennis]|nr:hypothetical protein J6590_086146 [Homalodisca vitripennis]